MRIFYVYIILFLSSIGLIAQDSYFKTISLPDQFAASGRVIIADGMDFYINSIVPCIDGLDTFNCMGVSRHNEYGELEWFRKVRWSIISNDRSLVISNDSLIISGHVNPKSNEYSYNNIILDKETGDSLDGFTRIFDQNAFSINNGIIKKGNKLYLYGHGSDLEDERIAMIYKYNLDSRADTLYSYYPENGIYHSCWDAAFNENDHIVIANKIKDYQLEPTRRDRIELLEVTTSGEIVQRSISPDHERTFSNPTQFIIDNQGNYIFPYIKENTTDNLTPTIMSMTPDEEVNWVHIYPHYNSVGSGYISLSEFKLAENGDVLISGFRDRHHSLGDGIDFHVARFTDTGEELWSRYYNIPIDWVEMEYYYHYALDLTELSDGSIVVVGTALQHNDIVLLRLDAEGCVEGYDCVGNVVLSDGAIVDLDYEMSIFPNPVTDMLRIESATNLEGRLYIYDSMGAVVYKNPKLDSQDLSLDISHFVSGIYYLRFHLDGGTYHHTIMKE